MSHNTLDKLYLGIYKADCELQKYHYILLQYPIVSLVLIRVVKCFQCALKFYT